MTMVGWLEADPITPITPDEAVAIAERAFEAAGVRDAAVRPEAVPGRYSSPGDEPVPVWKTFVDLDEGTVELWLARADGESVYLDDRTADGAGQLLTDRQFQALADHYENPALDRQRRRNVALTVAAALVVLVAATLARDPLALLTRHPTSEAR